MQTPLCFHQKPPRKYEAILATIETLSQDTSSMLAYDKMLISYFRGDFWCKQSGVCISYILHPPFKLLILNFFNLAEKYESFCCMIWLILFNLNRSRRIQFWLFWLVTIVFQVTLCSSFFYWQLFHLDILFKSQRLSFHQIAYYF